MSTNSLSRYAIRWLILAVVWMEMGCLIRSVAAQTPPPEGDGAHPSQYMYPLLTWTQTTHDAPSKEKIKDDKPSLSTEGKLQSIVIPHIEFRSTSLEDAVDFLYQESRRLDSDPSPDQRGVRIGLVRFPTPPAFPEDRSSSVESIPGLPPPLDGLEREVLPPQAKPAKMLVTLTMQNIPLLEALRYLAMQVGLEVKVGTDQVWLVPIRVRGDSETEEFKVRPKWLRVHQEAAKLLSPADDSTNGDPPNQFVNAKPFFESQGITFPPGASAVYLSRSHKLILRDTPDNIDLAKKLLDISSEELDSALEFTNP